MADDYSISYSYSTGGPDTSSAAQPKREELDTALYAFTDCEQVNLQNGGVLLIDRHSDRQMIVASEVALALQSCRVFRTLGEHVKILTATIPQLAGQEADVTAVLGMIRDNGLLITADSVCDRLRPGDSSSADPAPSRAFIITCDRPAAVQRLLQSMLLAGNLSLHEHLFLVDDSRDPGNAAQNREYAAQFNLTSPREIHYVGAEAQQRLLEDLIAAIPDQEAGIRFLIDRQHWAQHKTYGLARTVCLLLSVGRRAIVMDDDVICAAVPSPHKQEGLTFGDAPREVDFYTSQDEIVQRTEKADFNPLSGHATCLGLCMGHAVEKLAGRPLQAQDLAGANAAYLGQWSADTPILVTQSGTVGDPGTPGNNWLFTIEPASTRRLLASPGGLESALVNRHYWMGQPRPQFTKMSVISQMTGLDNSHLLPPYFPVFRGEDYLFGAIVEYLHPQSAVLEFDWSVPHFPVDPRQGSAEIDPTSGKGMINPSKYITDRTRYDRGISAETRLEGLAQMAQELSEMDDRALLTLYHYEVAQAQSAESQRLAGFLNDGQQRPEFWREFLLRSFNNVNESMQQPAQLQDVSGIPDTMQTNAILGEFRSHVSGFSSALQAWASIRASAATSSNALMDAQTFTP